MATAKVARRGARAGDRGLKEASGHEAEAHSEVLVCQYKHTTAGRFRRRFKTKEEADAYEADVRASGQEPEWAHTADLEELKRTVEKLSDGLKAAEERIRKLEQELSLTRRDIAALTTAEPTELPEDTELKERKALRDTFKAPDQAAQPKANDRRRTERLYRIHP